jgi:hypothetical protein
LFERIFRDSLEDNLKEIEREIQRRSQSSIQFSKKFNSDRSPNPFGVLLCALASLRDTNIFLKLEKNLPQRSLESFNLNRSVILDPSNLLNAALLSVGANFLRLAIAQIHFNSD